MKKLSVEKVIIKEPSNALFQKGYKVYREVYKDLIRKPNSIKTWAELVKRGDDNLPLHDTFFFKKDNEVVGIAHVFTLENEEKVNLAFQIPSKNETDKLKALVFSFVQKHASNKLAIKTSSNLVKEVAEELKLNKGNVIQHFKKRISEFSRDQLEEWAGKFPAGITKTIENYASISNYEDIANMMTSYLNDMVRPNKHEEFNETAEDVKSFMEFNKKNGEKSFIHLILRNEENKAVGLSIGWMSKDSPNVYEQRMTGLDRSLRGQKLGLALKAFCYLRLLDKHPDIEHVLTDCYEENIPIVRANLEMGFEPHYKKFEYYS